MNQHLAQDVFRQQCDKEGLEHQLESKSRLNQFVKILPKVLFRTDFTDSRAPLIKEYFLHMGFDSKPLYIQNLLFANRMDLLLLQSNLEQ